MESPAPPLYSNLMICLLSKVLFPHVILANFVAIDLYCSLFYEMLKLIKRCLHCIGLLDSIVIEMTFNLTIAASHENLSGTDCNSVSTSLHAH